MDTTSSWILRELAMSCLASSTMDWAVAVKTGGAWGGLRRWPGAMLEVVSSRLISVNAGEEVVGDRGPLKWVRTEERREVGEEERRREGATVTRKTPTQTTRVCRKRRKRGRMVEEEGLVNYCDYYVAMQESL